MSARFWSKVDKSGDCWVWTAGHTPFGYGAYWTGGRTLGAHRISYELAYGPIPDGLFVCHHCDNPPCVRPDHLFLGTHEDNMRDRERKGRYIPYVRTDDQRRQLSEIVRREHQLHPRHRTHCKRGHDQTLPGAKYVSPGGQRQCRTCNRMRKAASRAA